MKHLSSLIFMLLSNLILACYVNALLPSKKHLLSVITLTLSPLALLPFQALGLLQTNEPSLIKSIVGSGVVLLFILLFSQGSIFRKLFAFGTSIALMMIPELLITIPLAFFAPELTGYKNGAPDQIVVGAIFYLTYLPLQLALSAIAAILLRKKSDSFSDKSFAMVSLFPITLVIMLLLYIGFSSVALTEATARTSIIIGFLSILSSVAIYLALISLTRKTSLEQQAAFYQKQLDIQLEHYTQLAQYDHTLAQIRHDLRNETTTMQALLEAGNYREAQAFMEEMDSTLEQLKMASCCESNMINALIFLKHQEMRQAGVSFFCDIDLCAYTSAEEQKLCQVLDLLLADAVKHCPPKDSSPFVHLFCHSGQNKLEICCKASFDSDRASELSEDLRKAIHNILGKIELSHPRESVRTVWITADEPARK